MVYYEEEDKHLWHIVDYAFMIDCRLCSIQRGIREEESETKIKRKEGHTNSKNSTFKQGSTPRSSHLLDLCLTCLGRYFRRGGSSRQLEVYWWLHPRRCLGET